MNPAVEAALVGVLGGTVLGTGLVYVSDAVKHSRGRRDFRIDRRYAERFNAYRAFVRSAHAAQTAATSIVREDADFKNNYKTYDAVMANDLREVQLVGPHRVYLEAKSVAREVWDFRDALLGTDPPIVFSREPESEYETLRQRYVKQRDKWVAAASAVLGTHLD